jgi:hypothetical protein
VTPDAHVGLLQGILRCRTCPQDTPGRGQKFPCGREIKTAKSVPIAAGDSVQCFYEGTLAIGQNCAPRPFLGKNRARTPLLTMPVVSMREWPVNRAEQGGLPPTIGAHGQVIGRT